MSYLHKVGNLFMVRKSISYNIYNVILTYNIRTIGQLPNRDWHSFLLAESEEAFVCLSEKKNTSFLVPL